jgi:hypothetical protein
LNEDILPLLAGTVDLHRHGHPGARACVRSGRS